MSDGEPTTAAVAAIAELERSIVVTDPDLIVSFARDQSTGTAHGIPAAVLLPRSTSEVSQCLESARRHGALVVVRGAGSGLSGGANAEEGCLVLSTQRLDQILDLDAEERLITVQPGVVTAAVRAAATERGLFYPPDPGSVDFCSIGGNVATNAGGMCCVKYGVTSDFVQALEVVLADGTVLRTGTRTAKGVVGYDLRHLFTGSEGTLGVITEITLRLVPRPTEATTLVATFSSLEDAGEAVGEIFARHLSVSMLELLDETTVRAVDAHAEMRLGDQVGAMLLVQADDLAAKQTMHDISSLCVGTALDVAVSSDPEESRLLVEARRLALPALERLGDWILDDVCVPRGNIVDLVRGIEQISADVGLTIGVFGHAGDGNMHPTIIFDKSSPESAAAAQRAFDQITALALRLGGTVTGEHGTGRLKRDWAREELDETSLDVQRRIKAALDPAGVLGSASVQL